MIVLKRKVLAVLGLLVCVIGIGSYFIFSHYNTVEEYQVDSLSIQHQFLTLNEYSRAGDSLPYVRGIVIHYTANPLSTAQNNRDYFESLKDKHETKASSHFIIGLNGEVIQCIPLNEVAYASNSRNYDTISIECCHSDETGKFNTQTYQSLQTLVKALMKTYHLNTDDVIRHYDVTGKICPKYFVEHEDAWNEFLSSLDDN